MTASDSTLGRRAIALAVVAALAVAAYFWYRHRAAEVPPPAPPPVTTVPAPVEPAVEHPLSVPPDAVLPALDDSDATAVELLSGLVGAERFAALFVTEGVIRRLVATVDNLPRARVAAHHRPVRPLADAFRVDGEDDATLTLSQDNYARYDAHVRLIESLDADRVAAVYARLYPLLQKAYEELGYPGGYFNDRLVTAIDNLLAAPELPGPVELLRPNVMYEFADPQLEARSAGQKLMLRIGPDHAARVKAKLRELRSRIASRAP